MTFADLMEIAGREAWRPVLGQGSDGCWTVNLYRNDRRYHISGCQGVTAEEALERAINIAETDPEMRVADRRYDPRFFDDAAKPAPPADDGSDLV